MSSGYNVAWHEENGFMLRILERFWWIGAALASCAALLAWLRRIVPGGALGQEPYARYADHAEV